MSLLYTSNVTPVSIQRVATATPIEERSVVQHLSDLTNTETWNGKAYKGMCVSVVSDSTENNGLYMLINGNYVDKQSWDSTAQNYDVRGWRRIDGAGQSSGSVSMDDLQFDGTGSQASPYYLSNIDGGEISNDSNQIINNL